jgi:CO/xanthine dehydrogenase FAD-binding subunit
MDYVAPNSAQEVSQALSKEGAFALAGGTDLLVKLKTRMNVPQTVVDIKNVPRIRSIEKTGDSWWIGAATPCAEISEHADFAKDWPGVVEALSLIGSTQIQGRASLGGNLCNASPAADSVPALIAARTTCVISGESGEREVPVESIVQSPGKTSLKQGEFIVGFRLPLSANKSGDAYLRLIPRTEMDIAVVGAGVALSLDTSGKIAAIRIALGAVAPTQVVLSGLEDLCVGKEPNNDLIEKLVAIAEDACKPIDDKRGTVEYRKTIAGVLTKRAFSIALDRAKN